MQRAFPEHAFAVLHHFQCSNAPFTFQLLAKENCQLFTGSRSEATARSFSGAVHYVQHTLAQMLKVSPLRLPDLTLMENANGLFGVISLATEESACVCGFEIRESQATAGCVDCIVLTAEVSASTVTGFAIVANMAGGYWKMTTADRLEKTTIDSAGKDYTAVARFLLGEWQQH